jgi:hypothetical protein
MTELTIEQEESIRKTAIAAVTGIIAELQRYGRAAPDLSLKHLEVFQRLLAQLERGPCLGMSKNPEKPKTRKAPMSGAIVQAIARHKAAQAALDAIPHEEDAPGHLCVAAFDAMDDLAGTPCASDAEFIEKLRYLHAYEIRLGGEPTGQHEFGSVVLAVDCHFFPVNA